MHNHLVTQRLLEANPNAVLSGRHCELQSASPKLQRNKEHHILHNGGRLIFRFVAWIGTPRFFGKTVLNADGFGLAWYAEHETSCIYKDVHPTWSDANLKQFASHTKARMFQVHILASTSTATSRTSKCCYPAPIVKIPCRYPTLPR